MTATSSQRQGTPKPKPEGHVFTRAEVEGMSQDELLANLDAVNDQIATRGLP